MEGVSNVAFAQLGKLRMQECKESVFLFWNWSFPLSKLYFAESFLSRWKNTLLCSVSNSTVNSQTFLQLFYKYYIKWNVEKCNRSNENHQETFIKNEKKCSSRLKSERETIYNLYALKCFKLVRVYFVYSVIAERMQFICTWAWYVVFQRHNRLWKAITHLFNFKKGFWKCRFEL